MEIIYQHKAKYHETDQMGIIHHSNYIKWMEDARVNYMEHMGFSYKEMEQREIFSPVVEINCQYKEMVRFDDVVTIIAKIKEYNGVKLLIAYEIKNESTGKTCAIGYSKHCFINKEGKILSLHKHYPDIDQLFKMHKEL